MLGMFKWHEQTQKPLVYLARRVKKKEKKIRIFGNFFCKTPTATTTTTFNFIEMALHICRIIFNVLCEQIQYKSSQSF